MTDAAAAADRRASEGEGSLPEISLGPTKDFADGDRQLVTVGEFEIGVFRIGNDFRAYRNACPHQGGPVCEGLVIHRVEEVIAPDRTYAGMTFSDDVLHIACPWHGWEFDVRTGACAGDGKYKLRSYEVVDRGGELFVVV